MCLSSVIPLITLFNFVNAGFVLLKRAELAEDAFAVVGLPLVGRGHF